MKFQDSMRIVKYWVVLVAGLSAICGCGTKTLRAATAECIEPSFQAAKSVPFVPLASGDLNQDGKLDFIGTDNTGNQGTWLGSGNGTFEKKYELNTFVTYKPQIEDFNEDGNPDIAYSTTDGSISLMSGKGDGTFGNLSKILTGNKLSSIQYLESIDYNNDGHLDLVNIRMDSTPQLNILFGRGDGGFKTVKTLPINRMPNDQFAISDINSDGIKDIIISDHQTIDIYYGSGEGDFSDFISKKFSGNIVSFGDYNDDGILDTATLDLVNTYAIKLFWGDGRGNYIGSKDLSIDYFSVKSLLSGDVTGDGITDLIVIADQPTLGLINIIPGIGHNEFDSSLSVEVRGKGIIEAWLGDYNQDVESHEIMNGR